MPSNTASSAIDLDAAASRFRRGAAELAEEDVILQPGWRDEDWKQLFRFTTFRRLPSKEQLIKRGEPGRTLYFVLSGKLEVILPSEFGLSLGSVALIRPGSVLGEQAFFDGGPRSATVWAVDDAEVAAMSAEEYAQFEQANPRLARDLLFALGRILAIRLRKTTAKVVS